MLVIARLAALEHPERATTKTQVYTGPKHKTTAILQSRQQRKTVRNKHYSFDAKEKIGTSTQCSTPKAFDHIATEETAKPNIQQAAKVDNTPTENLKLQTGITRRKIAKTTPRSSAQTPRHAETEE